MKEIEIFLAFLEINWVFLILANSGKYHATYRMDTTGHEWLGSQTVPRV